MRGSAATGRPEPLLAVVPSRGRRIRLLVGLALATLFVLLNPHFNGDAPFYAISLADSGRPTWQPGHALWEPIAYIVLRAGRAVGFEIDPLVAMQVISGLATSALVLVSYDVGRRLGMKAGAALAAAALLACSANSLVMGGGGYAATSLSLGVMVAARALLPADGREWGSREAAIAVVALVLGWGAWGVAILAYPVIFTIAWMTSRGSPVRRVTRASLLTISAGLSTLAFATLIWLGPADAHGLALLPWLRSASHAIVFQPPDFSDLLRPALGVIRAFVELGSLGFSIKAVLLGDDALVDFWEIARWSVVLLILAVFVYKALAGLYRGAKAKDPLTQRLILLAVVAIVPTYAFSVWPYGGTEFHMHSTALPFLCYALVIGLEDAAPFLQRLPLPAPSAAFGFAAFVGATNLLGTCLPDIVTGGGLPVKLAHAAARELPPGSLLVVTGQDFRGRVIGVVNYESRVRMYNIANDVDYFGAEQWEADLKSIMASTTERGGQIAVLSDLLGDSTRGGVKLSAREYPVPTFDDVSRVLADWNQTCHWTVEQYRFVTLTPPGTEAGRSCRSKQ